MKDKYYKVSKIKHEVYSVRRRSKGKKYVLKPLSEAERRDLENIFVVEPWLYRVKLQFPHGFHLTDSTASIVKQLYYYKRDTGNYFRYLHLSDKQLKDCRDAELEVKLMKYKIS